MPATTADEDDPRAAHREEAPGPSDPPPLTARRGRAGKLLRLAATGVILLVAFAAAWFVWEFYVAAPWTRDGRVRVQVANIAPQVSGQIVALRVQDNQLVRKGDLLYVIDPIDFEVGVTSADAEVKNRELSSPSIAASSAKVPASTSVQGALPAAFSTRSPSEQKSPLAVSPSSLFILNMA